VLEACCKDSAWFFSELGSVAIPPPAQKTFDAEGEALEHALRKSFRLRNDAIKSLCLDACEAIDAAAFIERHRVSYLLAQSLTLASPSESLKGRLAHFGDGPLKTRATRSKYSQNCACYGSSSQAGLEREDQLGLNTHFGFCDVQNVTGLGQRRARGAREIVIG
jgi:hypothetical protein